MTLTPEQQAKLDHSTAMLIKLRAIQLNMGQYNQASHDGRQWIEYDMDKLAKQIAYHERIVASLNTDNPVSSIRTFQAVPR